MSLNKKFMPIFIIIIIIAAGVWYYFRFVKEKIVNNEMLFTGRITAASFQGKVDGNDFITVNGIQIKLAGGKSERDGEWGKIVGIDLGKPEALYIGKTVKVYATKYINKVTLQNTFSKEMEEDKVTIESNKNYYVEVVE